ncbi:MAG: translation repressor RelB [Raoultibacter sp.]
MPATQMNVRIDSRIKERGDAALTEAGYSPSQAVRIIWEFAACHAHDSAAVKELLQQAEMQHCLDRNMRIKARMTALEQAICLQQQREKAIGSTPNVLPEIDSDATLRGAALQARWEERGLW